MSEENVNENAAPEESAAQPAAAPVAEAAKSAVSGIIAKALALKEENPKLFFGAVGGVVLLLIIMMSMGGESAKTVTGPAIKNLVVGQNYALKSANAYDPAATVRLVSVPATMAAYDDTEEADRSSPCQHMPQGTPVKVIGLQDAYGKKNAFVNVEIQEGECKGNTAWALGIDVQ